MSAQNDESQGIVFGTVGLIVTLVIALLIGVGLHTKSKHHAPKAPATPVAAPAPVELAAAAAHTAEAHASAPAAVPASEAVKQH